MVQNLLIKNLIYNISKKSLKNKTKNIKNYLLDQKFVSGNWKYLC